MERVGVPAFLCIDEEGGAVTRISGTGKFDVPSIEDMWVLGQTGNFDRAYEVGLDMGQYLSDLGFNVDFAPVADVLTNEENGVVNTDPLAGSQSLYPTWRQLCLQVWRKKEFTEHINIFQAME